MKTLLLVALLLGGGVFFLGGDALHLGLEGGLKRVAAALRGVSVASLDHELAERELDAQVELLATLRGELGLQQADVARNEKSAAEAASATEAATAELAALNQLLATDRDAFVVQGEPRSRRQLLAERELLAARVQAAERALASRRFVIVEQRARIGRVKDNLQAQTARAAAQRESLRNAVSLLAVTEIERQADALDRQIGRLPEVGLSDSVGQLGYADAAAALGVVIGQ